MNYIDLTHIFKGKMPVYPGDSAPELIKVASVEKDGVASYALKTSMHVGTHMDAPAHMIEGGKYLHEYPAEKFFGRGVIIDSRGRSSADADLLADDKIQAGDIVIVNFGWAQKFNEDDYYKKYPELTQSFAQRLVDLGVSIVGTDTPSPDRAPYKIHKILLSHDILIIENLTNLEALIGKNNFEIIALPTKFAAEAAPCRVVAKI
jgi:kynurenine formamidase